MATSKVRVPGGGNTYLTLQVSGGSDTPISLIASFTDTPGGVTGGPTEIHPIGYEHPMEIVTGYAVRAGQLSVQVWSVWGKDGWVEPFAPLWKDRRNDVRLNGENFRGNEPINLMGVLQAQRASGTFIIRKYELAADGKSVARVRNYHNCVITNIDAGETVTNDSMPQPINIALMYTHSTVTQK